MIESNIYLEMILHTNLDLTSENAEITEKDRGFDNFACHIGVCEKKSVNTT